MMVVNQLFMQAKIAHKRARSGLSRTEEYTPDTGVYYCPHTHGAGLYGYVQCCTGQAVITGFESGITQGHDLGMRSGIMGADGLIEAFANDLVIPDHYCTDRYLTERFSLAGKFQCH
jgi:hypothetical protein